MFGRSISLFASSSLTISMWISSSGAISTFRAQVSTASIRSAGTSTGPSPVMRCAFRHSGHRW